MPSTKFICVLKLNLGYTLIEIIAVIVIMMICFFTIIPSLRHWQLTEQANVTVNKLIELIESAKVIAMQTGRTLTVCKTKSNTQCDGDWSDGQMLFFDDLDKQQPNDASSIIRISPAIQPTAHLSWQGFISNDYLQITPGAYTLVQNGHFCLQLGTQNPIHRKIIISDTGRLRITNETCDVFLG